MTPVIGPVDLNLSRSLFSRIPTKIDQRIFIRYFGIMFNLINLVSVYVAFAACWKTFSRAEKYSGILRDTGMRYVLGLLSFHLPDINHEGRADGEGHAEGGQGTVHKQRVYLHILWGTVTGWCCTSGTGTVHVRLQRPRPNRVSVNCSMCLLTRRIRLGLPKVLISHSLK